MDANKKYHFFISYSHKDNDKVVKFANELQSKFHGIKLWRDMEGISGNDDFTDKITTAINESERVLFLASKASMKSEYTRKEVLYAKNKGIPVVPILLEPNALKGNDWFLFEMGPYHYILLDDPSQHKQLLKNISEWIGKQPIAGEKLPYNNPLPNTWTAPKPKQHKTLWIVLIALALIALLGIALYMSSMN